MPEEGESATAQASESSQETADNAQHDTRNDALAPVAIVSEPAARPAPPPARITPVRAGSRPVASFEAMPAKPAQPFTAPSKKKKRSAWEADKPYDIIPGDWRYR